MQKGIATLEVVLAALIIALLMKVAVPNATKLIDRAALDYETKRLYSELRFLQAVNRSAKFNATGTGGFYVTNDEFLSIKFTGTSYQVVRGSGLSEATVREVHYLSYGVKLSWKSGKTLYTISTEVSGNFDIKNDTLILTSRLDNKNGLVFDPVGRLRALLKVGNL